jgi:hypothetical protein
MANQENTPSWANRAVDLSKINTSNTTEHQGTQETVRDKTESLSQARNKVLRHIHLPIVPRILLPADGEVSINDEAKHNQESYRKSIVELYVARTSLEDTILVDKEDTPHHEIVIDNSYLVNFVADEHNTLISKWHESEYVKKQDRRHKRGRTRSRLAHVGVNSIVGTAAYTTTLATGALNPLLTGGIIVAAGAANYATKTVKTREEEHNTATNLGDLGINTDGNANSTDRLLSTQRIKKRARDIISDEERDRSIHDDITKNLESFGFINDKNQKLSLDTILGKTTEFINEIQSSISLKPDYQANLLEIAEELKQSLQRISEHSTDARKEMLQRTYIEVAIALHDLEVELHDSKKIDKIVRKKRLVSALAAVALILIPAGVGEAKHNDNLRQEQIEKKQKTPHVNPGNIKNDEELPQNEQDSREQEVYDNLGN